MSRRKNPTDAPQTDTLAARFMRSAKLCRARDLKHLAILGDLVKGISELVHVLQKERGASTIYLGSNGARFAQRLIERVAESGTLEQQVRDHLEHVTKNLDPLSCSARFHTRVAIAVSALDRLTDMRTQVSALTLTPQDAVKGFSEIIALLLGVGFEAADVAADAETSRALIALVNFAQGKEYAGQERATAGAAISRGHFDTVDCDRLRHLAAAQERAFKVFTEFSDPSHTAVFFELSSSPQTAEFNQMRASMGEHALGAAQHAATPDAWYEVATRRIDAMKGIEELIAADLGRLCADKLAEDNGTAERIDPIDSEMPRLTAPLAMLITQVDPEVDTLGLVGGPEVYGVGHGLPKPMRSILDVVEAQSRRIDDINSQLESARVALAERKTVERAKGILMRTRRLSEKDAYSLLRQTAMSQNRRIFDVAEAIISMADSFQS